MEFGRTPNIWWRWSTSKWESKGVSIWLTHFGLCVMWMVPQVMLINSSKKGKELLKEDLKKYFGRKEKGKD